MRVNLPSAIRRAAPALALLALAGLTTVPANAQYGPSYYSPGPGYGSPYGTMAPYGSGYNNANGPYWNNASYYVMQNNPNRPGNGYTGPGSTDFGYATIPQPVNPDAAANTTAYDDPNNQPMYVYNFTGTAGPVYDTSYFDDTHCFPC